MKLYNKIVLLQTTGVEEFILKDLNNLAHEVISYDTPPKNNKEIIKRCQDADVVLITFTSLLDEEVIKSLPNLKHIALCCSLYTDETSNVDLKAAKKQNIKVTGVKEYGDDGVIEYILSELSRLTLGTNNLMYDNEPTELKSLKLGIIGLGSLGKKVAHFASLFGMDTSYYGRTKQNTEYTYMNLEELLSTNDVISMHLPRNIELLQEKEFNLMTGPKILIDTGLGLSFNEDAFSKWITQDNH